MTAIDEKPLTPLPQGLEVLHDRDSFIIRRRWFTPLAIFLVFFTLFWNGFMVVWMSKAIGDGIWAMAAFGSLHGLVGIGLAYYCVACFVNQTDISVDPNYLSVRHYPLPWPGSKRLRVHSIKQLYTKQHISRSKNGVNISYRLYVIMDDNREQKLLTGLADSTQAKYIEREMEDVIGIRNVPVSGEYN